MKLLLQPYIELMRLNKPIGSYLLLWPTYWALWIAAEGFPSWHLLVVFTLGVFIMRSAGCVINDYADRHVDGKVKRTQQRPLATGRITSKAALILFFTLLACAFALVLTLNIFTINLSLVAVLLAITYPFMKRYTQLPQVVLGAAFSWSIPMAFAATNEQIPLVAWLLFATNLLWTVAYDTMYAMVDRDDDIKIGIKSTAILFGKHDKLIIAILQSCCLGLLVGIGIIQSFDFYYYLAVLMAAALFVFQQSLIKHRQREQCFQAFLNNHYGLLIVFIGIAYQYF